MKIKFEKLSTANGKVYVNFGSGFEEYEISKVKDSGITIPENCTDYSSIQIKGSSVILNNLDVISSIKASDDNTISPEDITGIVLKDFKDRFDKSLLKTYPKLTSVTIPNSAYTTIEHGAFYFVSNLTSIVISDGITSIKDMAFGECKNLKSVDLPKSINAIGNDAFINCKSLTSISIPDGVKILGDGSLEGTFGGCTSLTSIVIPDSVTKMRGGIFSGCTSLKTINYKGTEIQWNAITKGYNWNYNCPSDLVINYNYGKESGDVAMKEPEHVSIVIGSSTYTSIIKSIDNYSQSVVEISGVGAIPKSAFKDIIGISNVIIHDGISSIKEFAFDSCSGIINEIIIPNTVTSIERYAFTLCENLPSIVIPDSVTSMGDYVFSSCLKLKNFYVPGSIIAIPNGAFYGCRGLTSITIPSNVTSIGKYAFKWCTSLKTINYEGTEKQWNAISKGTGWNEDCPKDMVINYNYAE